MFHSQEQVSSDNVAPHRNADLFTVAYDVTMKRAGYVSHDPHRTFIREWRENRGLSQDRLVERVREYAESFSKSTLSRLENGKQPYTQPILEALAWALDCSPADLIMRDPGSSIWSIMDELQSMPADQQSQIVQIIQTFKRAS